MSGVALEQADLMKVFEAARWAPSCFNGQPWRFVYARKGTAHFEKFLGLLVEANRVWCAQAGALVLVMAKKSLDNGNPLRTYSFDAGAAWMSLALQASMAGLVAHGMAGFDYDHAAELLQMPAGHSVEAMIALGYPGSKDDLPEPLKARETPNGRKPICELISEGTFSKT